MESFFSLIHFVLESHLQHRSARNGRDLVGKFQSFLCWNRLCNLQTKIAEELANSCFNPCYAGIASATNNRRNRCFFNNRFQSLLCWNRLCNRNITHPWSFCIRVSILVMLESPLQLPGTTLNAVKLIQVSILVMLESHLQLSFIIKNPKSFFIRFNPSYAGIASATK